RRLRTSLLERGRDLALLDLTADLGVPVVAAVSRSVERRESDTWLGFGAHLDPQVAAERALTVLCQFLPRRGDMERRLIEHAAGSLPWLEPSTSAPPSSASVAPDVDVTRELLALVDRLGGSGLETFALDQSRPDVPLAVVKVIVPGLRPWWARFAPGRLFTVPTALGWPDPVSDEAELNPIHLHL
ncbi:MAG: YcaO-like family protein, partial [Acidobacteriota bacterium]